MCESREKSGQEDDDKTKRRHGRISNRDGKMEGVTRQERICKECDRGEVEDVEHWLMRCEAWKSQRVQLEAWMQRHSDKCSTQDSTATLRVRQL